MPVVFEPTLTAFCTVAESTPPAACALPAIPATAARAATAASGRIPFLMFLRRKVRAGRPTRADDKAREPSARNVRRKAQFS